MSELEQLGFRQATHEEQPGIIQSGLYYYTTSLEFMVLGSLAARGMDVIYVEDGVVDDGYWFMPESGLTLIENILETLDQNGRLQTISVSLREDMDLLYPEEARKRREEFVGEIDKMVKDLLSRMNIESL